MLRKIPLEELCLLKNHFLHAIDNLYKIKRYCKMSKYLIPGSVPKHLSYKLNVILIPTNINRETKMQMKMI